MSVETGSRTLQTNAGSISSSPYHHEVAAERKQLVEALSELRNLVEEHSPSWYAEEDRRRVEVALHSNTKY
jgi:hypothetical protein